MMGDIEHDVREFYDVAGPAYETLMGSFWHHGEPASEMAGLSPTESAQELERKLVDAARLSAGDVALDFGSGVGGATVHMAKITGAYFVGLSNNEWLSQRAREHARQQGLSAAVSFHTVGDDDYKSLSAWPDDCLDMVSFLESVCHLPDKSAFFRTAFRILRPGAHLVGIDWLQRSFGEYQTAEQIGQWMAPVEQHISIPWHGTVADYRAMIEDAGFVVEVAEDLYAGIQCWGSTPPRDEQGWLSYDGERGDKFHDGKRALDAARAAGVFTVGRFVARKPS